MARISRPQAKSAIVNRMLGRERGASVLELAKATGWKNHSVRAFLTGVRKNAELTKEERADGVTVYRLTPTAALERSTHSIEEASA